MSLHMLLLRVGCSLPLLLESTEWHEDVSFQVFRCKAICLNLLEFQCSEHPVHCFVHVFMIVVVMILLAVSQNNPCLEKAERILTKREDYQDGCLLHPINYSKHVIRWILVQETTKLGKGLSLVYLIKTEQIYTSPDYL